MSNSKNDKADLKDFPDPEFRTKKRRISIVWLVPLVALAIGGWLVYKALSEKGPTVTITFKSAEGLEAGKTKIKYKDVELGQVDSIELDDDLSQVILKAELVKKAENFLSENTRFWVVRARIAAGSVSGLGTLFSGAFIGLDPGEPGKPATHFQGLEKPPVVTTELPGSHFVLRASSLGSLHIGDPVYFRRIEVGRIVNYKLDEDGQAVTIEVFIHDPHPDKRHHRCFTVKSPQGGGSRPEVEQIHTGHDVADDRGQPFFFITIDVFPREHREGLAAPAGMPDMIKVFIEIGPCLFPVLADGIPAIAIPPAIGYLRYTLQVFQPFFTEGGIKPQDL